MNHSAGRRTFRFVFVIALALTGLTGPPPAHASGAVEFVGSTPCDSAPRQFAEIPAGAACERISWQLVLASFGVGDNGKYSLVAVYGMQARNDPGFVDGGTTLRLQGTWTSLKGAAADPVIYRLTAGSERRSLDFVRVGENLLHPVNERRMLLVGNPGWSYTLSRRPPVPEPVVLNGAVQSAAAAATGVFEGRTPCQDLARVLNVAPAADCTKMKWRLTLGPSTYKLEGFVYRNPPRTGTWSIRRSASNPHSVVYDLDPRQGGSFASLLKVDDNHLLFLDKEGRFLVGDAHYSYTLNRVR